MAGLWWRAVSNLLIPWLKEYLKQRAIQSSGKHKFELEELCEKSKEMKVPKIATSTQDGNTSQSKNFNERATKNR